MKIKQTYRQKLAERLAVSTVTGLLSLLPLGGCANAGSTGVFQNQLNSTRTNRVLTQETKTAEKVMKDGRYEQGKILYIKMEDAPEVLKEEFNTDIGNRTYRWFYEGEAVKIAYIDPKTNARVEDVQVISGDCTIDTLDFGSFEACITREKLDEAITSKAKEKGIGSVAVTRIDHPMAETNEHYFGKAFFAGQVNGSVISGHAGLPLKAHRIVQDTGIADNAQYIMVNMPICNGKYDRVVAIASAQDVFLNKVTMCLGHDDCVVAVGGTSDWHDLRTTLGEIGGVLNDAQGISDALRRQDGDLHYFNRRNLYLPSDQGKLEKAVEKTGQVNDLLGNAKAIQGIAVGQ